LDIRQSFNQAVSNPENIQDNGDVNWNYVDADVYMDMHQFGESQPNAGHYEKFNQLADHYESIHGKQVQI
jgi:hypothetical protein